MDFVEGSNDGVLNGASEITLVAAPTSGVRRIVRSINIANTDTANVVLSVLLKNSTNERTIWKGTLTDGDTWQFGEAGDTLVLDSTSKSVVAFLSAAPATNNPEFSASYGDAS